VFALNYASFGVVMILFLLLEPAGLMGIWHRIRNSFVGWQSRSSAPERS
jgi:branched-chain amino acid transport system permease protein